MSSKEAISHINENPLLLSMLYDHGLLPEQIKEGSPEWARMIECVESFIRGKADREAGNFNP